MVLDDDVYSCQELSQESPNFEVVDGAIDKIERVESLPLFGHHLTCENKAGLMYAGGRISALNFHPTRKSLCAVAAHRQDCSKHEILKCYKGRGHIQLWNLSLKPNETHCIGVLPHNGNCTWDLKWRPTNTTTTTTTTSTSGLDANGSSGDNIQEALASTRISDLPSDSSRTVGTLAAALGDGTAIVATFQDFHLPDVPIPVQSKTNDKDPSQSTKMDVFKLNPNIMVLRAHKKAHQRSPVRVAEWSRDGSRLVLGIANGTIEVYEASSQDKVWPRWCIPAQDTVITGIKWMSSSFLCSVSISCVLRLRDMRNPVSSLEQNAESLQGSLTMNALEPTVAVIGTDSGTLRVIRLSGIDGLSVKQPLKRIYLQTNAMRDVQSIPQLDMKKNPFTLVFAGGTEGVLHECLLPRPIWPDADTCQLARSETKIKLRWSMVDPPADSNSSDVGIADSIEGGAKSSSKKATKKSGPDQNGNGNEKDIGNGNGNSAGGNWNEGDNENEQGQQLVNGSEDQNQNGEADDDSDLEGDKVLQLWLGDPTDTVKKETKVSGKRMKSKPRRSRAAGRDGIGRDSNLPKTVLFGPALKKRKVITRIAISEESNLLAVGIDDGLLTWTVLSDDTRKSPYVPKDMKSPPRKPKYGKRGRPKKIRLPPANTGEENGNSTEKNGTSTKKTAGQKGKGDEVGRKKNTKKTDGSRADSTGGAASSRRGKVAPKKNTETEGEASEDQANSSEKDKTTAVQTRKSKRQRRATTQRRASLAMSTDSDGNNCEEDNSDWEDDNEEDASEEQRSDEDEGLQSESKVGAVLLPGSSSTTNNGNGQQQDEEDLEIEPVVQANRANGHEVSSATAVKDDDGEGDGDDVSKSKEVDESGLKKKSLKKNRSTKRVLLRLWLKQEGMERHRARKEWERRMSMSGGGVFGTNMATGNINGKRRGDRHDVMGRPKAKRKRVRLHLEDGDNNNNNEVKHKEKQVSHDDDKLDLEEIPQQQQLDTDDGRSLRNGNGSSSTSASVSTSIPLRLRIRPTRTLSPAPAPSPSPMQTKTQLQTHRQTQKQKQRQKEKNRPPLLLRLRVKRKSVAVMMQDEADDEAERTVVDDDEQRDDDDANSGDRPRKRKRLSVASSASTSPNGSGTTTGDETSRPSRTRRPSWRLRER